MARGTKAAGSTAAQGWPTLVPTGYQGGPRAKQKFQAASPRARRAATGAPPRAQRPAVGLIHLLYLVQKVYTEAEIDGCREEEDAVAEVKMGPRVLPLGVYSLKEIEQEATKWSRGRLW